MSTQRTPKAGDLPEDGRVSFEDGDWVQFTLDPTHGQSKIIAKAILAAGASENRGATLDVMGETIATVARAGMLTDVETHNPIPFPFTPEGLERVSGKKVVRLFRAAMAIPDLVPNL